MTDPICISIGYLSPGEKEAGAFVTRFVKTPSGSATRVLKRRTSLLHL